MNTDPKVRDAGDIAISGLDVAWTRNETELKSAWERKWTDNAIQSMFDCDLRVNVKTMDGQLFESVRVIPGVDGWIWLSAKKDASGSSMIRDATLVQLSSVSMFSFQ